MPVISSVSESRLSCVFKIATMLFIEKSANTMGSHTLLGRALWLLMGVTGVRALPPE